MTRSDSTVLVTRLDQVMTRLSLDWKKILDGSDSKLSISAPEKQTMGAAKTVFSSNINMALH